MFEKVRRDAARYASNGGWYKNSGFWIVAVYRFGNWAHSLRSVFLRFPALVVYRLAHLSYGFFNIHLWAGPGCTQIGPGLHLIHPHNVYFGNKVVIGEDCLIFHEVTLGHGTVSGQPQIGNGVNIYAGARVLGGIKVGDGSMIGANCVVTRDVPANSVVVPPPCRIIPRSLSLLSSNADRREKAKAARNPQTSETVPQRSVEAAD